MSILAASGIIVEIEALIPPSLSGTMLDAVTEVSIVAGGKTILITLDTETYIAAGAAFDAQRQALIDKFVSDKSEPFGWNAVRSGIPVTAVVRTGDRLVTITITGLSTYDITALESITGGVQSAILRSGGDLVATPLIDIQPVVSGASIEWPEGGAMEWPEGGDITWP